MSLFIFQRFGILTDIPVLEQELKNFWSDLIFFEKGIIDFLEKFYNFLKIEHFFVKYVVVILFKIFVQNFQGVHNR